MSDHTSFDNAEKFVQLHLKDLLGTVVDELPTPSHSWLFDGAIDLHFHNRPDFEAWSAHLSEAVDNFRHVSSGLAAWHTGFFAGARVHLWLHTAPCVDVFAEDVPTEAVA